MELEKKNYLPVDYMIVNDDLYKRIGKEILPAKKDTFVALYGKEAFKKLPIYNRFQLVPSHDNFQLTIETPYGLDLNLYKELSYKTKAGKWDNIKKILEHVCGDYYEVILEWLWLTYKYPTNRTISLVFVGGRNSGKTSFLKLIEALIGSNYLLANPDIIVANYNEIIAGKIALGIDEKVSGREARKELQAIKRNMSSDSISINPKYKMPYMTPNYVRYVFCSNDVDSPLWLEEENERVLVINVPKIKNSDDRILKEMVKEIPAFAHYLLHEFEEKGREFIGNGKNRFWFPPETLNNDATINVMRNSRDSLSEDIEELIYSIFEEAAPDVEKIALTQRDISLLLMRHDANVKRVGKVLKLIEGCEYKKGWRPKATWRRVKKASTHGYGCTYDTMDQKKIWGGWVFTRDYFCPTD